MQSTVSWTVMAVLVAMTAAWWMMWRMDLPQKAQTMSPSPLYDEFSVRVLNSNQPFAMASLRDKVVLVVNVASRCGFTPQYAGLETLYRDYRDQGLEVLAFPCNDFGQQEPDNELTIREFCSQTYQVSFPMLEKVRVRAGDGQHPLFRWLTEQRVSSWMRKDIQWNFEKFLLDKRGWLRERYVSTTGPHSLRADIERLLREPVESPS